MLVAAAIALGILALLGVLIGRTLDRQAQEAAWRRIASARRDNADRARELDAQQIQMHEIEDALASRARRLESRDPPASGFPIDWPVVRLNDRPAEQPDSAA